MSETVRKRVDAKGPKRILSLDGGGVMGLVSLGYLEKIEETLRKRKPPSEQDEFRLSQYFDLIGGTSTGAIIASLLALGLRASEIKRIYLDLCPRVFRARGLGLLRSRYSAGGLNRQMRRILRNIAREAGKPHHEFPLDSELFQSGLAVVAKRIDTDSVWVQTNIPDRRFWDPAEGPFADPSHSAGSPGFFPNRRYRLRDLVRASAAAPTYLPPVLIPVAYATGLWKREWGAFIDGGASPHNNPSKELFLMAALKGYPNRERSEAAPLTPFGLGWDTGPDKMLMISIGTGEVERKIPAWRYRFASAAGLGVEALRSIIRDNSQDAVTWMQALSEPQAPWSVDENVGDLRNLRLVDRPLLSFQRYQTRLNGENLKALLGGDWANRHLRGDGLKELSRFDNGDRDNLHRLDEIGVEAAARDVLPEHLPPIFDL